MKPSEIRSLRFTGFGKKSVYRALTTTNTVRGNISSAPQSTQLQTEEDSKKPNLLEVNISYTIRSETDAGVVFFHSNKESKGMVCTES